ncbi:LOW QUALITY PROTEIN: HAUS augmin-like complex subunit 6 [Trematomus bernacchii]|uniref:LOW QUALITY PROTEIN: HAUS augmin-like complex subunit 6 n=1 Tax=Trematomus bernacchii TaxID=40690 RepID=UPI001469D679|nr:LOW QUALITY PROTEIN: HAUS augmin-like complex subunit 6 [Trematomus bernacchii]
MCAQILKGISKFNRFYICLALNIRCQPLFSSERPFAFYAQEGASLSEKARKVRSLWSDIDGMLSATKEEQNVVESVLKGDVDQYILDGTDQVLKIPRSLLERIEQLPHQLSSGNVYEAGQLNILSVFELTNHALQLLREERCLVSEAPKPQLSPQQLQVKCQQMARALQNLHLIRQRFSKEEIPEVRSAIGELEAAWDRKWMDTLKDTPLVSFLNEDPALGFLSPMAPLSFEPAADASYRSSIFSQYPASLLEKPAESKPQEVLLPSYSKPMRYLGSAEPCSVFITMTCNIFLLLFLFTRVIGLPYKVLDVKNSWRKAVAEDKAEKMERITKFNDSVKSLHTPLHENIEVQSQKGISLKSSLLWDTFDTEALDSLSGTGSSAVQFSLDQETLPEMPSYDSLLSLDDEAVDMNSWRKAVEEDKAEKMEQITKFNDGVKSLLTPLQENIEVQSQKGVSLKSSLLWDTFDTEALDSLSGTGSSAVQFSLDQETLPEMPSYDSLLSLDCDEAVDMTSEDDDDEELLIPSLKTEEKQTPLTTHPLGRIQQACSDGSYISRQRTAECLLTDHTASGLDRDWLMEPVSSVEATAKVFSLDLDTLKTPSPLKKQEYSLPKLITFSPMDDMK